MTTERTEELEPVCAVCKGKRSNLAPGREPEELCDPCYDDATNTRSLTPQAGEGVVEQVAMKLCEARGESPDGEQVRFVDGDAHSVSFLDLAKRDVRFVLSALPPAGRVEEMREALAKCRDVFRDYEKQHALKAIGVNSPLEAESRLEKARRNGEHAAMCDTALNGSGQP